MGRLARYFILILLSGTSCLVHAQEVSSRDVSGGNGAGGRMMEFESCRIVTDTLKEDGGPYSFFFKWKNTGKEPLTVLRVATSCGCVVPSSFDRRRVKPGDDDSLGVVYYPKGHPGRFDRKIFVYTDRSGNEPAAKLELQGYVTPARMPVWNYPHSMGTLLMKQVKVRFSGRERQVERILCFNAGKKPMSPFAVKELLPDWMTVRFEPETIAPASEADMVISFDPSRAPSVLPDSFPVIVEGPDVPPSSRKVTVFFKTL